MQFHKMVSCLSSASIIVVVVLGFLNMAAAQTQSAAEQLLSSLPSCAVCFISLGWGFVFLRFGMLTHGVVSRKGCLRRADPPRVAMRPDRPRLPLFKLGSRGQDCPVQYGKLHRR
jgi:hypothetical protein